MKDKADLEPDSLEQLYKKLMREHTTMPPAPFAYPLAGPHPTHLEAQAKQYTIRFTSRAQDFPNKNYA